MSCKEDNVFSLKDTQDTFKKWNMLETKETLQKWNTFAVTANADISPVIESELDSEIGSLKNTNIEQESTNNATQLENGSTDDDAHSEKSLNEMTVPQAETPPDQVYIRHDGGMWSKRKRPTDVG